VPVYFDFEGLWDHWTGNPISVRYPRPLPILPPRWWKGKTERPPPSPALALLLARPFGGGVQERPPHLQGPSALPRSQRKLVQGGQVEWRVLPDLARVPPYRGVCLSHVLLVRGDLRPGVRLLDLYRTLIQEARTCPFLLASDGQRVLIGAVTAREVAAIQQSRDGVETTAFVGALGSRMSGIDISRLPTAQLQSPVCHRYDKLLPGYAIVAEDAPSPRITQTQRRTDNEG
jgi:hypothetical protein